MSSSGSTAGSRRGVVVSLVIGVAIGVVAITFVVRALVRDREKIETAIEGAQLGWLVVAAGLAAGAMILIALVWHRALTLLDAELPWRQVLGRYFVGELGKYIPGGVWPVLGRGELAVRAGIRRSAAYGSVALSLIALYLAGALVVAVAFPTLVGDPGTAGQAWVPALLVVGLAGLHPLVIGRLVALAEWALRRPLDLPIPAWRDSVVLVILYTPAWLLVGTATWAVARSLDPSAEWIGVGVAAVLAWFIGFVVVAVPGGLGVREAAFVVAAGGFLEPGVAAAVAIIARVFFVLVDLVGAASGSWLMVRRAN